MKRVAVVFGIITLLLVGCTENMKIEEPMQEGTVDPPEKELPQEMESVIRTMEADLARFHFVADWWTETEIVFVEKVEGVYYIKTFNIETGEIDSLYMESDLVVDVSVHPSEKLILVQTAPDATAATVKILSQEGKVLDEITVSSSEIAIEWNDMDPTLLLVTAFYEDWTFDVFLYDGKEEHFGLTEIHDPFPKWRGTRKIVNERFSDHSLDGGELYEYDIGTGEEKPLDMTGVVYFDTHEQHLLAVQVHDEELAHYKIITADGEVLSSWTMPAVSNYSEWFFPELFWLSETELLLPATEKGGQLDRIQDSFKLIRVDDGHQETVLSDGHVTSHLACSPKGRKCLTGYALENMIDVERGQEMNWLLIPD